MDGAGSGNQHHSINRTPVHQSYSGSFSNRNHVQQTLEADESFVPARRQGLYMALGGTAASPAAATLAATLPHYTQQYGASPPGSNGVRGSPGSASGAARRHSAAAAVRAARDAAASRSRWRHRHSPQEAEAGQGGPLHHRRPAVYPASFPVIEEMDKEGDSEVGDETIDAGGIISPASAASQDSSLTVPYSETSGSGTTQRHNHQGSPSELTRHRRRPTPLSPAASTLPSAATPPQNLLSTVLPGSARDRVFSLPSLPAIVPVGGAAAATSQAQSGASPAGPLHILPPTHQQATTAPALDSTSQQLPAAPASESAATSVFRRLVRLFARRQSEDPQPSQRRDLQQQLQRDSPGPSLDATDQGHRRGGPDSYSHHHSQPGADEEVSRLDRHAGDAWRRLKEEHKGEFLGRGSKDTYSSNAERRRLASTVLSDGVPLDGGRRKASRRESP